MTCSQDKERLSAWRDGELGGVEWAAVSAHLSACADCRAVVEAYEAIGRDLAATSRIVAPPSILEGVRRGTGNVVPFRRPALLPFSIAAAAALIIAVNIAVFFSVEQRPPPPATAAPADRTRADEPVSKDGAASGGAAPVLVLARVDDPTRKAADSVAGRLREVEQRRRTEAQDRGPAEAERLGGFAAGTVYEVDMTQQEYDELKKLAADRGMAVEERADDAVFGYAEGGALKKEVLARELGARGAPLEPSPSPPAAPGAEKGAGRTAQSAKVAEELEAGKPKAAAPARFRVRVVWIDRKK